MRRAPLRRGSFVVFGLGLVAPVRSGHGRPPHRVAASRPIGRRPAVASAGSSPAVEPARPSRSVEPRPAAVRRAARRRRRPAPRRGERSAVRRPPVGPSRGRGAPVRVAAVVASRARGRPTGRRSASRGGAGPAGRRSARGRAAPGASSTWRDVTASARRRRRERRRPPATARSTSGCGSTTCATRPRRGRAGRRRRARRARPSSSRTSVELELDRSVGATPCAAARATAGRRHPGVRARALRRRARASCASSPSEAPGVGRRPRAARAHATTGSGQWKHGRHASSRRSGRSPARPSSTRCWPTATGRCGDRARSTSCGRSCGRRRPAPSWWPRAASWSPAPWPTGATCRAPSALLEQGWRMPKRPQEHHLRRGLRPGRPLRARRRRRPGPRAVQPGGGQPTRTSPTPPSGLRTLG